MILSGQVSSPADGGGKIETVTLSVYGGVTKYCKYWYNSNGELISSNTYSALPSTITVDRNSIMVIEAGKPVLTWGTPGEGYLYATYYNGSSTGSYAIFIPTKDANLSLPED